jgi:hypothetical protein
MDIVDFPGWENESPEESVETLLLTTIKGSRTRKYIEVDDGAHLHLMRVMICDIII